jgi:hypothetical protein
MCSDENSSNLYIGISNGEMLIFPVMTIVIYLLQPPPKVLIFALKLKVTLEIWYFHSFIFSSMHIKRNQNGDENKCQLMTAAQKELYLCILAAS